MDINKKKINTIHISDRILDLVLLSVSARLALITERIFHGKNWGGLDPESFNFYALIIIFAVWLVLIQIFEYEESSIYALIESRRIEVFSVVWNTALISFIGVTTTISLDFLLKTDLFQRTTILFFGIISFILLLFKRGGMKYFLSSIRQEERRARRQQEIYSKNL